MNRLLKQHCAGCGEDLCAELQEKGLNQTYMYMIQPIAPRLGGKLLIQAVHSEYADVLCLSCAHSFLQLPTSFVYTRCGGCQNDTRDVGVAFKITDMKPRGIEVHTLYGVKTPMTTALPRERLRDQSPDTTLCVDCAAESMISAILRDEDGCIIYEAFKVAEESGWDFS